MIRFTRQTAATAGSPTFTALEAASHELADRLPDLMIEAQRIAHTVAHGIHGRRRAGPGETFWQFRQYQPNDSTTLIDWRRTASATHVYVREREWEAAHTVWLWPDLSPSMNYSSALAPMTKRDRAVILTLAIAELLVRGGERAGLLGVMPPTASRRASRRIAEAIAVHGHEAALAGGLPPSARLSNFSGLILISDFLDPLDVIAERLKKLGSSHVTGHLIQVLDPSEESLPFTGRMEFVDPEDGEHWIADRAESLRERYQAKLNAHRDGLREITRRLGWSMMVHHTDRPASEPLLNLIMQLQQGAASYRWQTAGVGGAP
ncbi:conserved exported protein of unknown function [Candidatus Filomicrobium marinum]|uniref:DUF58 domain-containing protein n=2 Tax=Filomicrobium TaxID=119044 RepID=A0A0D6JA22_9HYPH|nr:MULTISPECIES: DUF58 domain-containing protein [Filomicrobium]MCV0368647.1 DUF58 domain-containing protein [Filomicrobium sp.]CFX00582.1 conserved exported protein of unknown function [Candidatus Filomicrobium marinum]CPR15267.1 conserved exported protein of unknown function [Candidatus Filomicrobium marinum]SDO68034.1 Protein of unknown function DUF58 [Filomicrobium insigne]